MKIINAEINDLSRLQSMYRDLSARLCALAPDYYQEAYQDYSLFTGIIEHRDAAVLIAVKNDEPVGMSTVWVKERPLAPHIRSKKSLQLSYLIAQDEATEAALIHAAENFALERGIDILQVSIHKNDNHAQKLHTGMGFEPEITAYTKKIAPQR